MGNLPAPMSKRLALGIVGFCVVAIAAIVGYRALPHYQAGTPTQVSASPSYSRAYSAKQRTSTYVNARFAYSVCYPPNVFVPQGEPTNGDGQKFISVDGQATAYVYGSNGLGTTLEQELTQDAQTSEGAPITLTSKTIGAREFTFTGSLNGQTFVERTLLQSQQFKTLNVQYPTTASRTYGPIAQQMMTCLANTSPTEYSNP
jgi:hypothetical protein